MGAMQQIMMMTGNIGIQQNAYSDSKSTASPTSAVSFISFETDGTVTKSGGSDPNWFLPTRTGIGSSYWVVFAVTGGTGGTLGGAALSTRLQISGAQFVNLTENSVKVSNRTLSYEIWDASTSGTLITSGTISLTSIVS